MKTLSRLHCLCAVCVLLFGLTLPAFGQPSPSPAERPAPAAPEIPPPAAPGAVPADGPAIPAETPAAEPALRRIDQIDLPNEDVPERSHRRRHSGGSDIPFGDHTVPAGSRTHAVVSIFGSSTVEGTVDSDVVSVLGGTYIGPRARVGAGAVAVLGRFESAGDIHSDAVSVLGPSTINGHVGGQAVSVLGSLHLGPNAVIDGDIVVVGGRFTKDLNAIVNGNEVRIPFLGPFGNVEWLTAWLKNCLVWGRPLALDRHVAWAWAIAFSFFAFYLLLALLFSRGVVRCTETLETRPGYSVLSSVLTVLLTPIALVLLAVTVVGALLVPFLGAGLVFAKLFGKVVMLAWIGRRFTKFAGNGVFSHPVFGVLIGGVIVLVLYTIPIVGGLTFFLLTWLGLGVVVYTLALSMRRDKPPALAVPVGPGDNPMPPLHPVEPATWTERPAPVFPATSVAPMASAAEPTSGVAKVSPGFSGASDAAPEMPLVPEAGATHVPPAPGFAPDAETASAPPPIPPMPPPVPPLRPPVSPLPRSGASIPARSNLAGAVAWPRAGFFIRLGALALDGVLIGLVMAFIAGMLPRFLHFHDGPGGWLIALALYGAVMWKHKGTTIGGIVCGLKVVRVDNRELDWATAIVRALACFLSLAVAGLGFIWVAIDDDKQSWHDKIAGTTVVQVPKGVSLL